tara:strand:+ start:807 stop:1307 length:501 start_codon:yes stop_codon:yes gene_type:complete
MISLDLLLKHMQWANKEIYTEVSKLDSEVLDYFVIDPEWKVKTIMLHIAKASNNYAQYLQGEEEVKRLETKELVTSEEIVALSDTLYKIDQILIDNQDIGDIDLIFRTRSDGSEKGQKKHKASTVFSQMVFHAAEHRAQIVAALDKHNVRSINLDNYDVWSFVRLR